MLHRTVVATLDSMNRSIVRTIYFAALGLALVLPSRVLAAAETGKRSAAESLGGGLEYLPGPVNGAFIERNGKLLVVYGDPSGSRAKADTILLTEARRDVTW